MMAPRFVLLAAAPLCAAFPAGALEATCRVPKGALNVEGISEFMQPGSAREPAGLDCGGQASAFCTELRRAFTQKDPPRLKPETIKAACDARAAEHWTGVWQGLMALQRGHSYSDAEKKAARDAYRTVSGALYRVIRGVDRPVLETLQEYYLNKTFVVSPEEDRRVATLASSALDAFEARLPDVRAGRLTKEDKWNWGLVRDLVERYYYTPGSNLPEQKEILRRFDALAAWFDVHELLELSKADAATRARLVVGDRLTGEGEAAAARAKQGRERLRLFALERVSLAIAAAPASARGEDVREAQAKARQRALDAARELGQDALLKEADDLDAKLRAPGTVPKPLSVLLDPANLPADIPAYMARFDPAYTAFVLKLTQTDRASVLMSTMRDGKTDPLTLRLRAAEVIYADITARRRCGEDRACFKVAVEEERLKVRATLQGTPGDTRWLMLAAARNINQQQARDAFLEIGKALLPGYACYELYDHWGKSTGGQKAADAAFCGLGAVPVVSAIARVARFARAARTSRLTEDLSRAERAFTPRAGTFKLSTAEIVPGLEPMGPMTARVLNEGKPIAREFPYGKPRMHGFEVENPRVGQVIRGRDGRAYRVDSIEGGLVNIIEVGTGARSFSRLAGPVMPAHHCVITGAGREIPVWVPALTGGAPDLKALAKLRDVMENMPRSAVEGLKEIRINATREARHTWNSGIAATADTHRVIDFYPAGFRTFRSEVSETMAHELGHVVAIHKTGRFDLRGRAEAAKTADKTKVSAYGETSFTEDFAEAMRVYVASGGGVGDPAALRRFSNRFALIDDLLGVDTAARLAIAEEFAKRLAARKIYLLSTTGGVFVFAGGVLYPTELARD